ncbi:DegT/DnrJ/EryC1/StrS aminotransferase, partial [Candidatus Roizmanbacteria bacterium CG06_land_8_20_14_3_00_34_14]
MIKLIKSTFYEEKKTKSALTNFINKAKILSFGPECMKFEEKFSQYQKRKYT